MVTADHFSAVFSGGSRISHRGGVDLIGGAVDLRGGYVSKILHVKMKESGSVGGHTLGAPPRSTNGIYTPDFWIT